ncbi:MAG: hypothetical protein ACOCV0_04695 [Alkalispirochaeta sp.]
MYDTSIWKTITGHVAEAMRLSVGELEALRQRSTAKLIVAIPYIAGCHDPDRVASQHLATYLLAERATAIFDHRREDDGDLFARLERISHFPGGSPKLIRRGMNLLALIMLNGYITSTETDRRKSVYNPVLSGEWKPDAIQARLVKEIRGVDSPEMDEVIDVEQALRGAWNT